MVPHFRLLSSDIVKITWAAWIILVGLAVLGLMCFTCLTRALNLISPNIVSSLKTMELVLVYVVQDFVTGDSPDIWLCFGGLPILSGVLILTIQDKIS